MGLNERVKCWVNNIFIDTLRSNTGRITEKKILSLKKLKLFESEDLSKHWAHHELKDPGLQNVVKGFIIDRISFIKECLSDDEIKKDFFIDIGDPSGIFIKALNKTGISANISPIAVKAVYAKGLESILCDTEKLPLKSNSIDHILFFEIFEHLTNPIITLHELQRVARKSVFLSIPYMTNTNIHKSRYNPDWPIFEHHVFEFNDEDFRKILSHTAFEVKNHRIYEVIGGGIIKERIIFILWKILKFIIKDPEYICNENDLYFGCFKKFSVYHLVKK